MNKFKIGLTAVAVAAVLVMIGAYFHVSMREKDETLLGQTDRIAQLEAENERLSNLLVNAKSSVPPAGESSRELLRLRGEVGVLRQQTNELGGLRSENIRLSQAVAESETNQISAEDLLIVRQNHAVDAMTTLLQAVKTYATNHNGEFPASLDLLVAAGDLKATNLAGNFGLSDFEFGRGRGTDSQGNQTLLRLRVPIAKPRGGGVMVVGGITDAGVPYTSVWNVGP